MGTAEMTLYSDCFSMKQYAPNMEELPFGVQERYSGPDCTGHCEAFVLDRDGKEVHVAPGDFVAGFIVRVTNHENTPAR